MVFVEVIKLLHRGRVVFCAQDARSNQLGYFVIVLRFFTITGKHVGISANSLTALFVL